MFSFADLTVDARPQQSSRALLWRILLVSALLFALGCSVQTSVAFQSIQASSTADPGNNYWALIVGIDDYASWPKLKTAANDAREVAAVLESHYGFKKDHIRLRLNEQATLKTLDDDLSQMARTMGPDDNWLIYFAGHGAIDDITRDGYWIPADGREDQPTTYWANSRIRNIVGAQLVQARSIAIVADSCFAGTLMRGGETAQDVVAAGYSRQIRQRAGLKSRIVISAGGLEPVNDEGRNGHSLFAYYFLKALSENSLAQVDLEGLFKASVWKPINELGTQRPESGRLRTTMDEDGLFVLRRAERPTSPVPIAGGPRSITVREEPLEASQYGSISIVSDRNGTEVILDSQPIGRTKANVRQVFENVPVGNHLLVARESGREIWRSPVSVLPEQIAALRLQLPAQNVRRGKSWALSIGISRYADIESLQYAGTDALAISDFLKSNRGGGFPQSQVTTLLNEEATRSAILVALNRLQEEAGASDTVFIYVAAMVYRSPKGDYLIPTDGNLKNLYATGINFAEFKDLVESGLAHVANRIIILDICPPSNALAGTPARVALSENSISALTRDPRNLFLMIAAKPGEFAFESDSLGHGVFTRAILDGLNGKAARAGEREVTAADLASYVMSEVPKMTANQQHPTVGGDFDPALRLASLPR